MSPPNARDLPAVRAAGAALLASALLALGAHATAEAAPGAQARRGGASPAAPGGRTARPDPAADAAAQAAAVAGMSAALAGADLERAAAAARLLGARSEAPAHEALLDALALGVPPAIARDVFAAVAVHPGPLDVESLGRYARHRDATVRASALETLAGYPTAAAQDVIVAGLHDDVGTVRATAAGAAARGRVRAAAPALMALLVKGDGAAPAALAAVADAATARDAARLAGRAPAASLAACLGAILLRPDLGSDDARVEVVRGLAKVPGDEAAAALAAYVDATPPTPSRASRQEAEQALAGRRGGR